MASSLVAKDTATPRRSPVESAWTPGWLIFGFLWLADDHRQGASHCPTQMRRYGLPNDVRGAAETGLLLAAILLIFGARRDKATKQGPQPHAAQGLRVI